MPGILHNFNFADEFVLLRVICGLFFIPHIYGKFFAPGALGFFTAAKFRPPAFWMYAAAVIEIVLAAGLILGLYTPYIAALACAHLVVAAIAVFRLTGKWLWNIGGAEYCAFWALCCLVVAMHSWPA